MNLFRTITTIFTSGLLFFNPVIADDQILVEPIKNNFLVLGKAIGKYSIVNGNACFKVKNLEIKLNPKQDKQKKLYITDVRFGLAIPYKGSSFDYLSQTDFFSINSELSIKKPIIRKNFKVCLKIPDRATKEKYFLSMEVGMKHPKYGRTTTYAHNIDGYINLMPEYALLDGIILEANGGEFDASNLGKKNTKQKISIDMKLVKYNSDPEWPPTAYAGFFQGENRSNSVQFIITKNSPRDNYVVVGYRLLKDDKEMVKESIANLKLDKKVRINMEIVNGNVSIKLNKEKPIIIKTHLKKVRPYIAVSSGAANFNIIHP